MSHDDPKLSAVLGAALAVFGRHGFRKTSMEAVAKAADISRPGLYLMYPNKEELYRATMAGVLRRAQDAAEARLADDSLDLTDRLVGALDELMGQYVKTEVARDVDQLIQDSEPRLGSLLREYDDRATSAVAAALAKDAPPGLLTDGRTAAQVTDILFAACLQWKRGATDRADFLARVTRLVRLVCRTD